MGPLRPLRRASVSRARRRDGENVLGCTGRTRQAACLASCCPGSCPTAAATGSNLQQVKDELGNRSNASAELEYDDAVAGMVGDEGNGLRLILETVDNSCLAVTVWSAAGIRAAMAAVHHAAHRKTFSAYLHDQPLMRNVPAGLALESEAATALAMRIAGAADRGVHGDENEAAFPSPATTARRRTPARRPRKRVRVEPVVAMRRIGFCG